MFPDKRDASKITHSMESMIKQRIYGIALGYEAKLTLCVKK
jgi:hypothetical protein